ncbi:MAG: D-alanine--D-alanine ligase family protein [Thermodesulfobacteriota bacterium]
MNKKIIAVIYGGCSVEHEISLISAESIIKNIDLDEYEIFPVYINKSGIWSKGRVDELSELKNSVEAQSKYLIPSLSINESPKFYEVDNNQIVNTYPIDLAFPILHGTYGEDGTVQGLFELMGVPYVGASVIGSSVGMDKIIMKSVLNNSNLPVVDFIGFTNSQWETDKKNIVSKIVNRITLPCFIKSADLGSSVGISKVENEKDIEQAVEYSGKFSNRILVEKAVSNCREFEVSVLGNDEPVASLPGEIVPKREFYDYRAKYDDESTGLIIPADLDKKLVVEMKNFAIQAFKVLSCNGMGRIDFLMDDKSKEIFISEINTIPGFTSISMYPKLWEVSGIKYHELIKKLIGLAFEKYENNKKLEKSYDNSI